MSKDNEKEKEEIFTDFVESNELADRITATMDPKILQSSKQSSEKMLKIQIQQMQQ